MLLPYYGVHQLANGVKLLAQNGPAKTPMDLDLNLDFKIRIRGQVYGSPHQVDIGSAREVEIIDDPLLKAMLPIPKAFGAPVLFMEETETTRLIVNQLTRLSSPIGLGAMVPLWTIDPKVFLRWMSLTNVMPMVIYGYQEKHHVQYLKLLSMASATPRKLLVMVSSMQARLSPNLLETNLSPHNLAATDLENMGAWALKQDMLS